MNRAVEMFFKVVNANMGPLLVVIGTLALLEIAKALFIALLPGALAPIIDFAFGLAGAVQQFSESVGSLLFNWTFNEPRCRDVF